MAGLEEAKHDVGNYNSGRANSEVVSTKNAFEGPALGDDLYED